MPGPVIYQPCDLKAKQHVPFMLLLELPSKQCESCHGVSPHCFSHLEACAGSNDIYFRNTPRFHLVILIHIPLHPFLDHCDIYIFLKRVPLVKMRLSLKINHNLTSSFATHPHYIPKQNLLGLFVCPALSKCSTNGSEINNTEKCTI